MRLRTCGASQGRCLEGVALRHVGAQLEDGPRTLIQGVGGTQQGGVFMTKNSSENVHEGYFRGLGKGENDKGKNGGAPEARAQEPRVKNFQRVWT